MRARVAVIAAVAAISFAIYFGLQEEEVFVESSVAIRRSCLDIMNFLKDFEKSMLLLHPLVYVFQK